MVDQAMVCTCCGKWRVSMIVIERLPGHPRQLLRITSYGMKVADVDSVEAVDQVLSRYGIDIANFVPEGVA